MSLHILVKLLKTKNSISRKKTISFHDINSGYYLKNKTKKKLKIALIKILNILHQKMLFNYSF